MPILHAMPELIDRLRAALGERYTVEREIGAGGMAIVFRAKDHKHHRPVAVKLLRPEIAASLGAERFLLEIEIAARLQHPHILPLYDSGSSDGLLFYVMPFVEDESLAQRLRRDGPLPLRDAYRIAAEVAGALDYAHRQGVVHRDIKPENIMISEGHAVVADFGIARAVSAAGGVGLTQAGMAVGTPAYMSPEQATGSSAEIDGRSDVYSLGCVLYEMLTGEVPFKGFSYQAILAQTLTGEIPRVSAVRAEVPAGVDDCVVRALAKQPERRFATAAEFRGALETATVASPAPTSRWRRYGLYAAVMALAAALVATWALRPPALRSAVASDAEVIAVLPFSTSGAHLEYLSEGMVDLLSTNLNGVGGVRTVDPRTVLARWRRRTKDGPLDLDGALAIGHDVDAGSVLQGSVVAAGGSVRLSTALYALDGTELARAQVEGSEDSVLALVDSLSLRLIREVWRSREPIPDFRVSAVTTGSIDAIRAFLEGERYYRRSQWDSAVTAFQRAVELDSTFALASLRLASTYGWTEGFGSRNVRAYTAAASQYAARLPARERQLVVASQLFEDGDLAAADSMKAFVGRYPDDVEGWFLLADVRFHAQPLLALEPSELFAPFDQVLELDSTMSPALIHPLELSLIFADSTQYFRYLRVLERSPEVKQTRPYQLLGEIEWRGRTLTSEDVVRIIQEEPTALGPLAGAAVTGSVLHEDDLAADSVIAGLDALSNQLPATDPRRLPYAQVQWSLLMSAGRLGAAKRMLDSAWAVVPDQAVYPSLLGAIAGYPDWPYGERALEQLRAGNNPMLSYWEAVYALSRGDTGVARRVLGRADTAAGGPGVASQFQALRGWLRVLQGDTTGGVVAMRQGILNGGFGRMVFLNGPVRYQLAATLVRRPETRSEGIRRLEYDWYVRGFSPFVLLRLAEALEAAGDREGAAQWYATFVRLWKNADATLQPMVDDAREALTRVTGEPTVR